jgi:hypothetical protein
MHNRWRWTPLENGEVEVEVVDNMDLRLPYILANARTQELWKFMSLVPGLLDREQYPNEKFDFVQEPATEKAARAAN